MEATCPRPEELGAYAEGRLGPAPKARLDAHLDECPACVGQLSVLLGLLQIPEPVETDLAPLPEELRTRLEKLVPERRAARPLRRPYATAGRLWKAALAAASILVTVTLFVLLSRPPARPPGPEVPESARRADPEPAAPPPPRAEPEAPRPEPPSQAHRRAPEARPPVEEPRPARPTLPPAELPRPEPRPEPLPALPKPAPEPRATVAAAPAATLEGVLGDVRLVAAGSRFPAKLGQPVLEGQAIETLGAGSGASLRFPDGSRVELWGDTSVAEVCDAKEDRGRRLRLVRGLVRAEVASQPEGRPLVVATPAAEARVLGTRFKLGADETRTVVEVEEGRVRLSRAADGAAVEVAAGQYAFAAELAPRPLPEKRRMPKLPYPGVDQAKVDAAIDRGVEWLLGLLPLKPLDTEYGEMTYDEIVLYTLLHAGLDRRHPAFQALLQAMLKRKLERTYDVALQAMALSELDPVRYQGRIAQCGQFLVDNQCDNGQWDYGKVSLFAEELQTPSRKDTATGSKARDLDPAPSPRSKPSGRIALRRGRAHAASGDNSNSQYAALGLRACLEAEVYPPQATLTSALKAWERLHDADGGWGYHGYSGQPAERLPYGSMTAGGLASVLIYRHYLKLPWKNDPHVLKAQRWIADAFSVRENPKMSTLPPAFMGPVHHYWLYALERAGVLGNVDTFGARDWYVEGARLLLEGQKKEGYWIDGSAGRAVSDTCFAILFLRRATAPLVASVDRQKK